MDFGPFQEVSKKISGNSNKFLRFAEVSQKFLLTHQMILISFQEESGNYGGSLDMQGILTGGSRVFHGVLVPFLEV